MNMKHILHEECAGTHHPPLLEEKGSTQAEIGIHIVGKALKVDTERTTISDITTIILALARDGNEVRGRGLILQDQATSLSPHWLLTGPR